MLKLLRVLPLCLLPLLISGCATTITNLTPTRQPRNASGFYTIEAAWDTRQQSIRPESLTPYVVVDLEAYPMRPTLGIANRWETLVPVPADKDSINYHFKVDYKYNVLGSPKSGSKLSRGYKLTIVD